VSRNKSENILNEVVLDRGKFHRFHANICVCVCVCVCMRARARAHTAFISRHSSEIYMYCCNMYRSVNWVL
jgi:hypothetical protein